MVVADTLVRLLAEGDAELAQPSALVRFRGGVRDRDGGNPQISRIMINNPMTTTEVRPRCWRRPQTLHTTKYGALPVLRDGKLVGTHWDATATEAISPDAWARAALALHVGDSFADDPRAEPLLPLRGDAAAPRRDRRLHGRPRTARPRPRRASRWRCSRWWRRRARRTCRRPARTPVVRRRARLQPLLPLDRGAGAPGRDGRMRRRQLLPGRTGHPRADGRDRAAHARSGARAAGLRRADVRRRARAQPLLPVGG